MSKSVTPPESRPTDSPILRSDRSEEERAEEAFVVLDERTLEEPLEHAMQRVRSGGVQRILVITREDSYAGGPILTPRAARVAAPADAKEALLTSEEEAIRSVGETWLQNAEIIAQWIGEAKTLTRELEHEASRIESERLHDQVRRLIDLAGWMELASSEQRHHAAKAAIGMTPHDTVEVVTDAARAAARVHAGVEIRVDAASEVRPVSCRSAAIRLAFQAAIEAVCECIGGVGRVRCEIEEGQLFVLHRILGEPAADDADGAGCTSLDGVALTRLRELIVDLHGGRIFRHTGEYADTSLVVALPLRRMEADCLVDW